MGIRDSLKGFFEKVEPLKPQMLHLRKGDPASGQQRLHLRIEPGGRGILVINAAKVIHLNQTAAEMVKLIMEQKSDDQAIRQFLKRYKIDKETAKRDFLDVKNKVETLASTDEICPVTYLGFSRVEPFSIKTSAPQRMDLALTYECDNDCTHCYVEREKSMESMSLEQWKKVIAQLWKIGIPHVCFTGGEATLSPHLLPLIEYAEEIGIVTGLLTNGRRLADREFTKQLMNAGLDHVQITLESANEAIHDEMVCAPGAWKETVQGIKNAIEQTIYLVTNSTLSTKSAGHFIETLEFLHELGVTNFACNGFIHSGEAVGHPEAIREEELPEILERIRDKAGELEMNFIWYTPTQYCNCNPVELELGMKRCTAGVSNMCIEPDGSVLPCQSYYESLGNILSDDWGAIWNHSTLAGIRERKWIDPKCDGCEELEICGGGCPLYLKNGKALCTDMMSNSN